VSFILFLIFLVVFPALETGCEHEFQSLPLLIESKRNTEKMNEKEFLFQSWNNVNMPVSSPSLL